MSWAWSRVSEVVPVEQLVGLAAFALAACTVVAGLLGALLPGPMPLVMFGVVLVVLLGFGGFLVLAPHRGPRVLPILLVFGPIVWMAMVFTWADHGWVVTPIALVYAGALAGAFYSRDVLTLVVALCLGAGTVFVVEYSAPPSMVASTDRSQLAVRAVALVATVVIFSVGVHLLRRRVTHVREALRARSTIDALTGLPNRRHVNAVAGQLLAAAHRQDREVYTLQLDFDRLATINQESGDDVGDRVISTVARIARQALRPEDMLIRSGGEVLLAAGVVRSQFEAVRIAERLRIAVRRADLPVAVTCSIGVAAARPGTGVDATEWLWNLAAIAEESLAAAKASGRDRVTGARQSGDVLGDALELVTTRSTNERSDPAVPVPVKEIVWTAPSRIARVTGSMMLIGALLLAVAMQVTPTLDSPMSAIFAMAATGCVGIAALLVLRPSASSDLLPILIFCADVIWAGSSWVSGEGDGYISSLSGVIMCGFAAWLFSRPYFIAQQVVMFPLTFVLVRGAGLPVGSAIWVSLLHAGTIVLAAIGLYLLRLHSEFLIRQTAASATIDPTTGLANRRLLAERAPALVAGAARQEVAVSVVLIDLIDFWLINERYGYRGGDKVLATVGQALYRSSRSEDTLLRLDGDNFLIICVGDPEDARRVADRTAAVMGAVSAHGGPVPSRVAMASAYPQAREDAIPWLLQLVAQVSDDMHQAPHSRRRSGKAGPGASALRTPAG